MDMLMTDDERSGLRIALCCLATRDGWLEWCPGVLDGLALYWDGSMTVDNGILGKYYAPARMHLPMWMRAGKDDWTDLLPTVCHELVHARQRARMGRLRWAVANNPLWRRFTIEPAALAMERRVEKLLGLNYMG